LLKRFHVELIWVAEVMVGGSVDTFQIIRRQLGLYRGAEKELTMIRRSWEELLEWGWVSERACGAVAESAHFFSTSRAYSVQSFDLLLKIRET
jgi:hypothetical protein